MSNKKGRVEVDHPIKVVYDKERNETYIVASHWTGDNVSRDGLWVLKGERKDVIEVKFEPPPRDPEHTPCILRYCLPLDARYIGQLNTCGYALPKEYLDWEKSRSVKKL